MEEKNISNSIKREAADWFARLTADDVTAEDRTAFVRWIDQSADHKAAYEQLSAAWISIDSLDNEELDALAREASAVPESPFARLGNLLLQPVFAAGGVAAATALAVCVAVFGGLFVNDPQMLASNYETDIGDTQEVVLQDGSVITLNTASKVSVAYSDEVRSVILDQGEAFFDVKSDENRPFRIAAGDGVVEVLGTQFNVRRDSDQVRVAVVEGIVSFSSARPLPESRVSQTILTTGEGGRLRDDIGLELFVDPNIEQITAWREGWFVFRGTPLPEVVREINRYSRQSIELGDASLSDVKINGVFSTKRIPELLSGLEKAAPVEVRQRGGEIVIVATEP